jgi:hypothetical protein
MPLALFGLAVSDALALTAVPASEMLGHMSIGTRAPCEISRKPQGYSLGAR